MTATRREEGRGKARKQFEGGSNSFVQFFQAPKIPGQGLVLIYPCPHHEEGTGIGRSDEVRLKGCRQIMSDRDFEKGQKEEGKRKDQLSQSKRSEPEQLILIVG